MKKYNEGYTLPFVLVVFLIISLVAVSILTVSIHNLHGQKSSIQRMQAQYTAQGEIEKVIAELIHFPTANAFNEERLDEICGAAVQYGDWQYDKTGKKLSFSLKTVCDTVEINCKVVMEKIEETEVSEGKDQYLMEENWKLTFDAYTVSTIEPTATEESTGGA